eukprot:CAMPEP_0174241356 /NCGR_PEP_ID=MMETSP0417-20130205/23038_1 /TAXON_ID=242541 /ORGANISM="Mayorella sp, Strain BSH-02190019" /LENGTH=441 /DNA_ID=CAMNT_0015320583 /DNA_START=171 /DNA_END=1496 /DNA_ORIENTATION=-
MAVLAKHCPDVTFTVVDIDAKRIAAWNSDQLPIFEPGLDVVVQGVRGKNLFFSTEVDERVKEAQIIFIAVNTSTKEYGFDAGSSYDMTAVEIVARNIGKVAEGPTIVVEKSTVPVRTASMVRDLLEVNSELVQKGKATFEVLSNPEFLAEGMAIPNLESPDRVLIGSLPTSRGHEAAARLSFLYEHWIPKDRIITTNVWSSELSKLAANAFLAQRVSSINSFSAICERTGADVGEVAHVLGTDKRIGSRFLHASIGFGGSCFRKDLEGLIYLCEGLNLPEVAEYWRQVLRINEFQKMRFSRQILSACYNTLRRKRIAVLGFAFKADTGDSRDSAAIDVVRHLLEEKAEVHIYDPKVPHEDINRLFPSVRCHDDALSACDGAHALVVLTEWEEFLVLDFKRIFASMPKPSFVFDGRNCLDHSYLRSLGFTVHAIGKRLESAL